MLKFQITHQIGEEDCGAACVSMVLNNYFQTNVSLCEIRPIIKNTQSGTSFGDLQYGLSRFGINSKIFKVDNNILAFSEMVVPLITQIIKEKDQLHYVIITKITNKYIYYADSEFATLKKKKHIDFNNSWVPYIIQIDLTTSQIALNVEKNLDMFTYKKLFLKSKGKLVLVVILSLITYLLGIFMSSMYTTFFDVVIPNKLVGLVFSIMIIYLIVSLVKFMLNFLSTIIINSLNKSLDSQLSTEFFKSIFRKSASALEYFGIGETITTLSNIVMIRQRFFTVVILMSLNCLMVISSFVILAKINAHLSILLLLLMMALLIIVLYANNKFQLLSKKLLYSNRLFNDTIIDIFSNTKMIKQYQQDDHFVDKGKVKLIENISERNKLLNFDAKLDGVKTMVLDVFNILLFSLGSYLIIEGTFVTGTLLMYNSIISFSINPIMTLTALQSILTQGKTAEQLLYNLLKSDLNMFQSKSYPSGNYSTKIELVHVDFSFDSRKKLLEDINLTIKDNENVALTGSNGSGKTTLGKLIARHYVPDSGEIKLSNLDINDVEESEYLANVLFVDSDEGILSSSIMDNIILGRNIAPSRFDFIVDQLGLNEFVENFENGYESPIGVAGLKLSLGQNQLIKIARATMD